MSVLFIGILKNVGLPDSGSYKSWNLKRRLKRYFGDRLVFLSQPGKSDLMFSSLFTMSDVLTKINKLHGREPGDGNIEYACSSSN